jgi:probable rRNA maturation factor
VPGSDPCARAEEGPRGDQADAAEIIVSIAAGGWNEAGLDAVTIAAAAARTTLARSSLSGVSDAAVDITLTDDGEQQELNRLYRGQDRPTNVLAFPVGDPHAARPPGMPLLLGDIVLAWTTIRREAQEQGKTVAHHLSHLVVHGMLHLLGCDHQVPAEAAAMEAREIAILAELGVPDPYRDTI